MVTAVCNIYLNTDLKLKLFKDSIRSVYDVSDNWLIYIRGKFKTEAEEFVLSLDINKNVKIFKNLNDKSWGLSVKEMLNYSKYNFIYIYIEDHFLVQGLNFFKEVISDAINNRIDYFSYSFFNCDIDYNTLEAYYPDYSEHFSFFELNEKSKKYFKANYPNFFSFSLLSVVSKHYFIKILEKEYSGNILISPRIQHLFSRWGFVYPKNRILLFWINKKISSLNIRFTLYTPSSPLNMEKSIFEMDKDFLPVTIGIVNHEIFANFDDDNGAKKPSLIKRGEYPKELKVNFLKDKIDPVHLKKYILKANEKISRQFYQNSSRQTSIYLKYIYLVEGEIEISSDFEKYFISRGEWIYIYANKNHNITALSDSVFSVKLFANDSWMVGGYF